MEFIIKVAIQRYITRYIVYLSHKYCCLQITRPTSRCQATASSHCSDGVVLGWEQAHQLLPYPLPIPSLPAVTHTPVPCSAPSAHRVTLLSWSSATLGCATLHQPTVPRLLPPTCLPHRTRERCSFTLTVTLGTTISQRPREKVLGDDTVSASS